MIDYISEKQISVYRFSQDSGIPQSTLWSIIKKEDYEVREKNIRKICAGMGISVGEILEDTDKDRVILRIDEIPMIKKYRKLGVREQGKVEGYLDALFDNYVEK